MYTAEGLAKSHSKAGIAALLTRQQILSVPGFNKLKKEVMAAAAVKMLNKEVKKKQIPESVDKEEIIKESAQDVTEVAKLVTKEIKNPKKLSAIKDIKKAIKEKPEILAQEAEEIAAKKIIKVIKENSDKLAKEAEERVEKKIKKATKKYSKPVKNAIQEEMIEESKTEEKIMSLNDKLNAIRVEIAKQRRNLRKHIAKHYDNSANMGPEDFNDALNKIHPEVKKVSELIKMKHILLGKVKDLQQVHPKEFAKYERMLMEAHRGIKSRNADYEEILPEEVLPALEGQMESPIRLNSLVQN